MQTRNGRSVEHSDAARRRLIDAMTATGETYTTVALACGLPNSTVRAIFINRGQAITIDQLTAIAQALGVPLGRILGPAVWSYGGAQAGAAEAAAPRLIDVYDTGHFGAGVAAVTRADAVRAYRIAGVVYIVDNSPLRPGYAVMNVRGRAIFGSIGTETGGLYFMAAGKNYKIKKIQLLGMVIETRHNMTTQDFAIPA